MLFKDEKIGETTVQLHNGSGSQTDWLILINEKEEIVGKLLAFIEVRKENAAGDQSGMKKDMTDKRKMPLRNHEQVLLLHDQTDPQTQITHQTQNS